MYLFDTNMFSFAVKRNPNVVKKVKSTPFKQMFISGIAAEEVIGGFYIQVQRFRTNPKSDIDLRKTYESFFESMRELSKWQLLSYTNTNEKSFHAAYTKASQVKANDWRVAVQAVDAGMIVVTNNDIDFRRIKEYLPALQYEDWTKV